MQITSVEIRQKTAYEKPFLPSQTQFKTFYARYIIWGHAYEDEANKTHMGIRVKYF